MPLSNSTVTSRSIPIELSFDNGSSYKTLVCVQTKTFNLTVPTTENDTDCGLKVGTGVLRVAISGTAIVETRPSATECSHQEIVNVMKTGTSVLFRFQNPTSGSTGVGLYIAGSCKITGDNLTGPSSADLIKMDFNMLGEGDITVEAP